MPLGRASVSTAPGGSGASIVSPEGDDDIDDEEETGDEATPERRRRNFMCTWEEGQQSE
jgi:hypothetical protein